MWCCHCLALDLFTSKVVSSWDADVTLSQTQCRTVYGIHFSLTRSTKKWCTTFAPFLSRDDYLLRSAGVLPSTSSALYFGVLFCQLENTRSGNKCSCLVSLAITTKTPEQYWFKQNCPSSSSPEVLEFTALCLCLRCTMHCSYAVDSHLKCQTVFTAHVAITCYGGVAH